MPWWQQPSFQVALPIMITFVIATWYQTKRLDDLRADMNRQFDAVNQRLERIESLLGDHDGASPFRKNAPRRCAVNA